MKTDDLFDRLNEYRHYQPLLLQNRVGWFKALEPGSSTVSRTLWQWS